MEYFEILMLAIGGLAGLVTLWNSAEGWKRKLVQIVSLLVMVSAIYTVTSMRTELAEKNAEIERRASIERQAATMLSNKTMKYTHAGFIAASLAFLEKHKSDFPDTYARAILICENTGCFESPNKRKDRLEHGWDAIAVASQMAGVLRGIADMNDGRSE